MRIRKLFLNVASWSACAPEVILERSAYCRPGWLSKFSPVSWTTYWTCWLRRNAVECKAAGLYQTSIRIYSSSYSIRTASAGPGRERNLPFWRIGRLNRARTRCSGCFSDKDSPKRQNYKEVCIDYPVSQSPRRLDWFIRSKSPRRLDGYLPSTYPCPIIAWHMDQKLITPQFYQYCSWHSIVYCLMHWGQSFWW